MHGWWNRHWYVAIAIHFNLPLKCEEHLLPYQHSIVTIERGSKQIAEMVIVLHTTYQHHFILNILTIEQYIECTILECIWYPIEPSTLFKKTIRQTNRHTYNESQRMFSFLMCHNLTHIIYICATIVLSWWVWVCMRVADTKVDGVCKCRVYTNSTWKRILLFYVEHYIPKCFITTNVLSKRSIWIIMLIWC